MPSALRRASFFRYMNERIVFVDWLRVIACMMVMLVHSSEPFYLGSTGTDILSASDAFWVTTIDSAVRAAVPLFVLASSYLLFPLRKPAGPFFKRRLQRVAVPFVVWVVILAAVLGVQSHDFAGAFRPYLFNFNMTWGHMWFVYMILGLYLIMPVLSPWAEKVSKRGEQAFLAVWLFTTLVPFFRLLAKNFSGSTELWGEANWNEFGVLYYVSGFVGYLVLGHYFKKWVPAMSWKRTLSIALPLWIVGYGITAGWFWAVMPKDFPVHTSIDAAVYMEQSWRFSGFSVALTVIAYFMIIRKITYSGFFYQEILLPLSKASYGTYLMHLALLYPICGVIRCCVPTWACIPLTALSTFIVCSLISIACSKIPVVGQYIAGYKS